MTVQSYHRRLLWHYPRRFWYKQGSSIKQSDRIISPPPTKTVTARVKFCLKFCLYMWLFCKNCSKSKILIQSVFFRVCTSSETQGQPGNLAYLTKQGNTYCSNVCESPSQSFIDLHRSFIPRFPTSKCTPNLPPHRSKSPSPLSTSPSPPVPNFFFEFFWYWTIIFQI